MKRKTDIAKERIIFSFLCILLIGTILLITSMYNKSYSNKEIPTPEMITRPFGLVFQNINDYKKSVRYFMFSWDTHTRIEKLTKENAKGVYVRYYNLTMTSTSLSNKYVPDYEFIISKKKEWLIRNKEGTPSRWYYDKSFFFLDLGNQKYVEWVIGWLRRTAFKKGEFTGHLGLDYGIFYRGADWANYETNEAYQDAWEYFLSRLSEAFRPQYKIILNVGSCNLPTFARMIRHVDGVLHEDLCHPLHKPGFDPEKARQSIQDKWEKGKWCMENGKIWAVRYNSTINGLKLSTTPKTTNAYISVGDREIIVSTSRQEILGKVNLDSPEANTLIKVAQALEKTGLRVEILNPYGETASAGALQPVKYAKIGDGLILKRKQAPREAFLFGYCAVLMVAGPNSYFIIGDERHQEYYYPEMDWPVGSPLGPKKEIAPQVYHRAFTKLDAYLNLSESPFLLPDGHTLLPFRGGLIKKVVTVQSPL